MWPFKKRSHEDQLFRIKYLLSDSTPFNMKWACRFVRREDGGVYDRFSREYISTSLWKNRVEGLRWPNARHDFRWTGKKYEDFAPGYLPTAHSKCSKCGDERMIYMGFDPTQLPDGWCVR